MKKVRLIARLDIKGPNLIKGIHLEGLRVVGSPNEYAMRYYEQGADELIYKTVRKLVIKFLDQRHTFFSRYITRANFLS